MTLRNRGLTKGVSKVFAPFMAVAVRRANQKDLAREVSVSVLPAYTDGSGLAFELAPIWQRQKG